ncbi:FRG domain-containing protein [Sphingomonas sediminicola]|uniref:FRG domain-containing protein n=1 Tax=Sphingomonas sediminicola TaxID=386874 RepID=A0ABX6T710_9SPHN|nr:FRG domain-containing protein [Sphingomonas sediminicola]QNP45647.1 FRG domain-containing protein [Sphingomonas sediminicola]
MPAQVAQHSDVQETFRTVFESVNLPYLAVDVDRVAEAIRDHGLRAESHCSIPLIGSGDRRDGLVGSWRGLLRRIDPPEWVIAAILDTPTMGAQIAASRPVIRNCNDVPYFAISESNDELTWTEETIWPIAYSSLLRQLKSLVDLHQVRIQEILNRRLKQYEEAGLARENVGLFDETTRILPTDLHYAFASLGAWLGGAMNVQYFASYAVAPQLRNPEYALSCAAAMGYTRAESRDLDNGGLVAVPIAVAQPLISTQGDPTVFGSIPVNEFSAANPPHVAALKRTGIDPKHPGFLIDRHYRGTFLGRAIGDDALYGARNVLRDHFEGFYPRRQRDDLIRCRQFSVPVYEVGSIEEAREIVAQIPIHDEENGIFFRGQTGFYTLDRPRRVKRLLFGNSCAIEPSLPTSASRHRHEYDPAHFSLRFFLEHHVIPEIMDGEDWKDAWRASVTDPELAIDYAMMAFAQHYGLPSHGLDVTTSLDVATWFATQKYSSAGGIAQYNVLEASGWPKRRREWPTVFVFQNVSWSLQCSLQDCRELEAFGLRALRPERQSARFFLGGHSEHRNRLAETAVCVLRLKPASYETTCDFGYLFPSPDEDPGYRAMLRFAEQDFSAGVGHYVNRFHPD